MINTQEDIYNLAEMYKSSGGDKTAAFTSSLLEGETKSGISSEVIEETMIVSESDP